MTNKSWQLAIENGDIPKILELHAKEPQQLAQLYDATLWAIFAKQIKTLELLLQLKARVDPSLLEISVKTNQIEAIQVLVSTGFDINTQCRFGNTALMTAARLGNPDFVRLLLESGADPDIQSEDGLTALHHALVSGNEDICIILANIVDISFIDKLGWNYLTYAAAQANRKVCTILMERGLDPFKRSDKNVNAIEVCNQDMKMFLVETSRSLWMKEQLQTVANAGETTKTAIKPKL